VEIAMRIRFTMPLMGAVAVSTLAGLLSGCSSNFSPKADVSTTGSDTAPVQIPMADIAGTLNGGQSPISGASIYVYAVGTSGFGGNATLLSKTVPTTKTDGTFNVTGDYSCTSGQQVYIVALGGNAGSGTNTAISQMAYLGPCGNIVSQVSINEISTVIFAYAVGGFGTSYSKISTGGSAVAVQALANSFAMVPIMMNVAGGFPDPYADNNSNYTLPAGKFIELANILAACVNAQAGRAQCTNLFSFATAGGVTPTDESTAIFNIVANPMTVNVASMKALVPASPAFGGANTAVTDFTMPVVYNSALVRNGTVGLPGNIALDASGNVWVSDKTGAVVKMTPNGQVSSYVPGGPISYVAVNPVKTGNPYSSGGTTTNNIWAINSTNNTIYIMSPTNGSVLETITSTANSSAYNNVVDPTLNLPQQIAFDGAGNAYVSNGGNSFISEYSPTGALQTALSSSANSGFSIALDSANDIWETSVSCNCFAEETNGIGTQYTLAFTDVNSRAVAVDNTNTAWIVTTGGRLESSGGLSGPYFGTYLDFTFATGGGMNSPVGISLDGSSNIWIANSGASVLSEFSTAPQAIVQNGVPTGSTGKNLAVAVDASGNVWTANSDGSLTQLLSIATPVATPTTPSQLGTTP
jgi:hypothetical protein